MGSDVGGSLTGEHGIGVEKISAMPWLFSDLDLGLMEEIKRVRNANDLCNPGKVIPSGKLCWETDHGSHLAAGASPNKVAVV